MNSPEVVKYVELYKQLLALNRDVEIEKTEELYQKMDVAWDKLSPRQIKCVNLIISKHKK